MSWKIPDNSPILRFVRSGRGGGGPRGRSVGAADGVILGLGLTDRLTVNVFDTLRVYDIVRENVSLLVARFVILPLGVTETDKPVLDVVGDDDSVFCVADGDAVI